VENFNNLLLAISQKFDKEKISLFFFKIGNKFSSFKRSLLKSFNTKAKLFSILGTNFDKNK
jgi:hypothetical protein